ncbi:MAG: hypothetical protein AAFV45_05650 [Pseudomonadota bacterium]
MATLIGLVDLVAVVNMAETSIGLLSNFKVNRVGHVSNAVNAFCASQVERELKSDFTQRLGSERLSALLRYASSRTSPDFIAQQPNDGGLGKRKTARDQTLIAHG